MEAVHWRMTFRIRSQSAAALSPRILRPWWSTFPDQPAILLTDGSLLLATEVQARDARHALLLGRYRVSEFFPGPGYRLESLTLYQDYWQDLR